MALKDISTVVADTDFRNTVKGAMVKTAVLILGEQGEDGKEIKLEKRHNLAHDILNAPESKLEAFCWAVAQNAAISLPPVDGDIEFTVVSVFNDIAGVKNSES